MSRLIPAQFKGFASDTLPAERGRTLARRFSRSRSLGTLLQAIRASHASAARLGPFGFGKWVYHKQNVRTLLEGKIYEAVPVTVEFVPTLECNFSCLHCTYELWKVRTAEDRGRRFMDFELMKYLLDKLKAAGVKAVIWTGGGEPTLHPRLLEGMRHAKELGLENGLFTNGSRLTPEMIEELLLEIAPVFIRVSLNAPTPEVHREFHRYSGGEEIFSRIIQALKLMAKMKADPRNRIQTRVGIGALVNPINVHSIGDFDRLLLDLLTSEGVQSGDLDYFVLRPEVVYGGRDQTQHPADIFEQARTAFQGRILPAASSIEGFKPVILIERFADIHRSQQSQVPHCLAHPWRVSVAYDGRVYLCAEQNGNPDFCIGDLTKKTLAQIWRGRQRRRVIAALNRGMFQEACPPICILTYMNLVFGQIPFPLKGAEVETLEEALTTLRGQGYPDVDFL